MKKYFKEFLFNYLHKHFVLIGTHHHCVHDPGRLPESPGIFRGCPGVQIGRIRFRGIMGWPGAIGVFRGWKIRKSFPAASGVFRGIRGIRGSILPKLWGHLECGLECRKSGGTHPSARNPSTPRALRVRFLHFSPCVKGPTIFFLIGSICIINNKI